MNENTRRPSGIQVNGVPSVDEIIEMGRNNVFLAGALSYWRQGSINFDEALRLAIYYLLESNAALNRVAQDLAAKSYPGQIILEHPISCSTESIRVENGKTLCDLRIHAVRPSPPESTGDPVN